MNSYFEGYATAAPSIKNSSSFPLRFTMPLGQKALHSVLPWLFMSWCVRGLSETGRPSAPLSSRSLSRSLLHSGAALSKSTGPPGRRTALLHFGHTGLSVRPDAARHDSFPGTVWSGPSVKAMVMAFRELCSWDPIPCPLHPVFPLPDGACKLA